MACTTLGFDMQAYIIAHDGTERTASLHKTPDVTKAWINWTRTLLEGMVSPVKIHVVGDVVGPGRVYEALKNALKEGDWINLAKIYGKQGPLLFVSPFSGYLSRNRLQGFLDSLLSLKPQKVLRSRYKVDANINPFWLRPLPHDGFSQSTATIPLQSLKKVDPMSYCRIMDQRCAHQNITGSQYLPTMYTTDDTLLGLSYGPLSRTPTTEYHYYDKESDDSLPMLYKIGILNLHPRQHVFMRPELVGNIHSLLPKNENAKCRPGVL